MTLEPIVLIGGILSLIWVIVAITVGLKMASKFIQLKERILLYGSVAWILMVSIWFSSSISVILILTTGQGLSDELYMLIGNVLLPFALFAWMIVFTDLVFKEYQKLILFFFAIYVILFDIYFLYFFFTDMSVLGEVLSPVDATYSLVVTICQFSDLLVLITTGIIFSIITLKSEIKEIKLKGKLLLIAFISIFFGVSLEIISNLSIMILVLARVILVFSSIMFYGGFILPNWMKKLLLRKDEWSEESDDKTLEDKKDIQHFLKLLGPPGKITEEEVAYYREQTICLVCKKKLDGFTYVYICTKCRALFCEKCAKALINLENACWSCFEAIDKSKPVKSVTVEKVELIDEVQKKKC